MGKVSIVGTGIQSAPQVRGFQTVNFLANDQLATFTGGGISANLPRVLPKGKAANIQLGSWPMQPVFQHLQKLGNVDQEEMMRTFNMGIGMILVVPPQKFKRVQSILDRVNEKGYTIGRIVKGDRKVIYS